MYLALARKYRPQDFTEVLGQEAIVKTLQNAISTERLHHAYLFSGVRGVGKTSMARILAKSINCEKGPSIKPCQVCSSCVSITQGNSLDVIEIDGASNNLVDDVRELREQVKFLPATSRYKIIIIDEVHMLSNSAFNALLKTLEEPPAHVIFIFATTEPHKIPVTILSRCQKYDFRKLTASLLFKHLQSLATQEKIAVEEGALRVIAHCAQGSVRDAISLLDQVCGISDQSITETQVREVLGLSERVLVDEILSAIVSEDVVKAVEKMRAADERGVDLKLFAEEVLQLLNHVILFKSTKQAAPDLSPSEQEVVNQLATKADLSLLLVQYQILFQGIQELAFTDFQKTSFEITLVKLANAQNMIDLAELVDQLQNRGGVKSTDKHGPTRTYTDPPGRKEEKIAPAVTQSWFANWYDLVRWLTKEKPPLGSLLKDAVPVMFGEQKIEIALSPQSQMRSILTDRIPDIQQMIQKAFGKNIVLTISDLSAEKKAMSLKEVEKEEDKQKRIAVETELKQNEAVSELLGKYGAKVKEIIVQKE